MRVYLSFLLMYIYVILSDFLENVDNWIYIVIGLSCLIVSSLLLLKTELSVPQGIIIITIFTTIIVTNIVNKIKDKDENKDESLDVFSSLSLTLFGFIGFLAHYINHRFGDICPTSGPMEVLCDNKFILIFVFMNFCVINLYSVLKKHKAWPYNSEVNPERYMKYLNIVVMCIWQIYVYMLIDGFKESGFHYSSLSKGGSNSSMYEIFSYISIFLVIALFVTNIIGFNKCDKNNGYVNDIKELQYNLLTSTILTFVIIFFRPMY